MYLTLLVVLILQFYIKSGVCCLCNQYKSRLEAFCASTNVVYLKVNGDLFSRHGHMYSVNVQSVVKGHTRLRRVTRLLTPHRRTTCALSLRVRHTYLLDVDIDVDGITLGADYCSFREGMHWPHEHRIVDEIVKTKSVAHICSKERPLMPITTTSDSSNHTTYLDPTTPASEIRGISPANGTLESTKSTETNTGTPDNGNKNSNNTSNVTEVTAAKSEILTPESKFKPHIPSTPISFDEYWSHIMKTMDKAN